jgi:hypothetical protein
MNRLQPSVVALLMVLVCGALTVTSAHAVTFLLALWLVNGAEVITELAAEGKLTPETGEILLEDTKVPLVGKVTILCSGSGIGWIGPNSLAWVSEALLLSGIAISSTPLSGQADECSPQTGCESNSTVLLWPVHLGYENEVVLMEEAGSSFFVVLTYGHSGGGSPGWEVSNCLILGVSEVDECTAAESVIELRLEGVTLLAVGSAAITELAGVSLGACTQGGPGSGVLEGEGVISLPQGGELSASSEGVEA